MYRVLLADDEADVREGLIQEIDWQGCGFEVIGVAENGREAMELAERLSPEVLVTDISMPFIDGLTLAEWMREKYPLTKIVLLTGYDEFDYARQAVRIGVDEYLLKPFSAENLTDLLAAIRKKIEREIAERDDVRQLREHYRTSLPMLRATFLASLMTRKLSMEKVEEKSQNYDLALSGRCYEVAVVSLQTSGEHEGAGEHSLRSSQDLDLKLYAVLNIAEEIWKQQGLGNAFIYQEYVVLLSIDTGEEDWQRHTQQALDNVLRSVDHYLRLKVTIGVGSAVSDIADVKDSFEDALLALDYRLVAGSGRLIYIGDVEHRRSGQLRFDELKEQALVRSLKVGTEEELEAVLDILFGEIGGEAHSYNDVQVYLLEILTAVLKTAKDADLTMDELLGGSFQLYGELFRLSGLAEARRWFHKLCGRIMEQISSRRQHSYRDIVEQAISYTKENYHDPDISIQRVCSHLHISTGYFSGIFKKEVKLTFGQYLMQTRMEAAKELLRGSALKAFEIAERVGFADPNYFSFCFKKQVGISPKEYRSRSLKPDEKEE
ncbi:DNA-binding response regulator [Paenibacillus sambharensis]|uniref:DNA-binding response regulator n=1 Tax=Paenibacillus sambharensis TaxID=1803190 RepID=A0A2W1L9L8_9BACL|nr:response regulator [Paenibacillus sambharensis]PZD95449.1 DNA-binding response regulator [Paenibacillus sambharensis]